MRYVLDTNVLLHYAREGATHELLKSTYQPFSEVNESVISIVTVAEIYSLARKHKWGKRRTEILESLLSALVVVNIQYLDLIEMYVDIESYNNGNHPTLNKAGSTVVMGKNDLWIAATAAITEASLLTSDNDFDHLDGVFFKVIKYK